MTDRLRAKIEIDRDALDDAIEEQPGLYLEASDSVAMALSRRDESKSLMDQEFAKACDRARRAEEKKTEAGVKEAAQLDRRFVEAEARYRKNKADAELALSLRDSYDMRGKMLREMCNLFVNGYFQAAGISGKVKREINDDAARTARSQLNRARVERRR